MDDQAKFILGVAIIVIFFLSLYCVYIHFTKWRIKNHLKHKRELANYYQDKYESLSLRHEYLKHSASRVAQLYKIHKERNQIRQKQEDTK